jgi:hypothetical protein
LRGSTVIGIVTNLDQLGAFLWTDDQPIAELRQYYKNILEQDIHSQDQDGAAERMEDDDLIDMVQEL